MSIQSILFKRSIWSIPTAISWLDKHGFVHYKVDITKNFLRFRQHNPATTNKFTFTKKLHNGIELIIQLTRKK